VQKKMPMDTVEQKYINFGSLLDVKSAG